MQKDSARADDEPGNSAARRLILVADDNRDAADSLAELLDIWGNEVLTAYDGLQALMMAAAFQPRVIILDIGMPKLSGHEVCRRIRALPWGQKAVLIALSGWGRDEDKRLAQEAGFDHQLIKPADSEVLARLLAEPPTKAV